MAVVMVHESPGGTAEQYAQVAARLTDGRGLNSLSDWPVEGILSHVAGPTDNGWRVVDVWESEEAFQRLGEVIIPILLPPGGRGELLGAALSAVTKSPLWPASTIPISPRRKCRERS